LSELIGAAELIAALQAKGAAVEAGCIGFLVDAGALVEAKAKENVVVDTGQLRRSIHTEGPIPLGGGVWMVRVMPDTAYARRIELGFFPGDGFKNGLDSLGRQFYQYRPYKPYLEPALMEQMMLFRSLFAQKMQEAMSV
jgi:hypothetical protein